VKKDKHKYHSIRKPNYLGNKKTFQEFLSKNLVYPQEALEKEIRGIAHVKCEIDDKGKVLKAESIHKLGYGLDEEAERLCLLMKFENTTERGLRIKHTRTVRIPFVLPAKPSIQINYQTTPAEKKEEPKTSYTYTIKF
jgi:TonB family protein